MEFANAWLEVVQDWINGLLKLLFPGGVPVPVSTAVTASLVIAFLLMVLWGALFVSSRIKNLWKKNSVPCFTVPNGKNSRGADGLLRITSCIG